MGRTTIFYYTGTGNSLWTARELARQLGNTELISMTKEDIAVDAFESPVIGLIFPVHIWGVPHRVLDFLDRLALRLPVGYIFAVATNGGQVSKTLIQLQQEMTARGMELSAGWSVELPSNYIPWGGPGSEQKQTRLFDNARRKIPRIAAKISTGTRQTVEKGPLWQRIVFTWIYNWSFPHVHQMDKSFWTDDRCNQCGICAEICPTRNILMEDGKLIWQNHCEQCLACIQWCPKEALQYGKKTPGYDRYHHPEVKIKDFIK
ncbi:MAG TPA: EFR1 family ferrodoxin [Syntrophomonas sp.]|nr:EFR1 family ferrodoxin [Syntrophomonas sp.]